MLLIKIMNKFINSSILNCNGCKKIKRISEKPGSKIIKPNKFYSKQYLITKILHVLLKLKLGEPSLDLVTLKKFLNSAYQVVVLVITMQLEEHKTKSAVKHLFLWPNLSKYLQMSTVRLETALIWV